MDERGTATQSVKATAEKPAPVFRHEFFRQFSQAMNMAQKIFLSALDQAGPGISEPRKREIRSEFLAEALAFRRWTENIADSGIVQMRPAIVEFSEKSIADMKAAMREAFGANGGDESHG
jgi:hypothetical protein